MKSKKVTRHQAVKEADAFLADLKALHALGRRGIKTSIVRLRPRDTKDLDGFLRLLVRVRKATAKSTLRFKT